MYAVIASGGKQEKVAQGEKVQVELLGIADGEEVRFAPVLFVDGDTVHLVRRRETPSETFALETLIK